MGKPSQREYGPSDGPTPDALKPRMYALAAVTEVNATEIELQP